VEDFYGFTKNYIDKHPNATFFGFTEHCETNTTFDLALVRLLLPGKELPQPKLKTAPKREGKRKRQKVSSQTSSTGEQQEESAMTQRRHEVQQQQSTALSSSPGDGNNLQQTSVRAHSAALCSPTVRVSDHSRLRDVVTLNAQQMDLSSPTAVHMNQNARVRDFTVNNISYTSSVPLTGLEQLIVAVELIENRYNGLSQRVQSSEERLQNQINVMQNHINELRDTVRGLQRENAELREQGNPYRRAGENWNFDDSPERPNRSSNAAMSSLDALMMPHSPGADFPLP
jgi:hypothetical protein